MYFQPLDRQPQPNVGRPLTTTVIQQRTSKHCHQRLWFHPTVAPSQPGRMAPKTWVVGQWGVPPSAAWPTPPSSQFLQNRHHAPRTRGVQNLCRLGRPGFVVQHVATRPVGHWPNARASTLPCRGGVPRRTGNINKEMARADRQHPPRTTDQHQHYHHDRRRPVF